MPTEQRCPTNLLDDAPAENDVFGGHEMVAQSIAEVIQTEAGGKAIGLEGGWGAGKSTIVKITSTILGETKNREHRTVVFDTWTHQDDPLRRTFLENLITRMKEFNWVNTKKWDRRLAELTKRRSEDTTTVVPKLSGTGIVFALTLLVIPIGSAVMSAGITVSGSQHASGEFAAWLVRFGIAGAFAPAIFCGILAAIQFLRIRMGTAGTDEAGGLNEFPALVTGQATTESRTIVTRTPDPTSVEFEREFSKVLSEALKTDNRRLLLVIDNLDRVQPPDALSIWSTLQTFLGHSDYRRADWIRRLWVLIPYDGNAILRLWGQSRGDATDATDSRLAASFLDKTFQLRFKAPPLLLLDWREFLEEALQEALPHHKKGEFRDVYRAFAADGGFEATAPTPRDLKLFVNQIGTLHRARQHEFPLFHLACYALLQRDRKNLLKDLLCKCDLETPRRIIGKQWRDVIAALYFGATIEEARQILLRAPIQGALADGEGATLSNLALTHPGGFWSVLEDCVPAGAEDWNTLTPAEIGKAATALAESRILDQQNSRPEAESVRSRIRTAAAAVEVWAPFDAANSEGMVAAVSLAPDPEKVIPLLIEAAANAPVESPGRPSDEQKQGVSPRVWMSSAIFLIKGLLDLGHSEHIGGGIRVPLNAQQWLDASNEVAEKDPKCQSLKYLEIQAIAEIDQQLAQRVTPGQIDENTFYAVRAALATSSGDGMKNVASTVLSRLRSNWSFQADQLVFLLKMLRSSRSAGLIANDENADFAGTGQYLHLLYLSASDSHPEAVAECMFGFLEVVPDASPRHYGNYSSSGHNTLINLLQNPTTLPGVVEHFIAIAEETENLAVVFEMANGNRPVPRLLALVLRVLLTSKDVSKPPELVRANWSIIREVLETGEEDSQTLDTFLRALPGLVDLGAGVVNGTFDVDEGGLYIALLKNDADANFVTWCANGLSSVSREVWSQEIASQGDLLDLVTELKARGASVVLGADYFDALVDCARNVAVGGEILLGPEAWVDLLSFLDTDRRELFPRRAYKILEESEGGASAEYFDLFGDMLSARELLANEPRFIDQVCRPILDKEYVRGIEWIAEIVTSHPDLLTRHDDQAAVNDFVDRIRQRLDVPREDDPTLPSLKRIGAALRVGRLELGGLLDRVTRSTRHRGRRE